jgi:malate dehydrogenase (oxaloacetate-decarboxylating)
MDYGKASKELHEKLKGKIRIESPMDIKTPQDLSLVYTPGVGAVSSAIAEDESRSDIYTRRQNLVAVISDGSAVLGLGNLGPKAAMPVMEGKSVLFKSFGDVDAVPLCLDTQDTEEIIKTVKYLAPTFGGINLEDISAPRCFEIEERLQAELDIPVFHDDQHGTAIVLLAALYNALKITEKSLAEIRIVVSGAGAAGVAIIKLLHAAGARHMILVDSRGIVSADRDNLTDVKRSMLEYTNTDNLSGDLAAAMNGADAFIGVSAPGIVTGEMIRNMASDAMVFAMANPMPEIMPVDAMGAGAAVVATGRSDFANQVNNALVFPGLFRGLLDARVGNVTDEIKLAAARGLADLVENPTADKIIPSIFDDGVADAVAGAVRAV